MSMLAFDSLAYFDRLKEAGVPEPQAKVHASALREIIDEKLATKKDIEDVRNDIEALRLATQKDIEALRLATQRDIEALRLDTRKEFEDVRREIEALRIEMQNEMQKLEMRLTIKLGGMIAASIAIVAALVKLL